MGILLACSQGLITPGQRSAVLPCPLRQIDLIARDPQTLAAVDVASRLLWLRGRVIPVEPGIEALMLLPCGCLTLSGDTDCLTLRDPITGIPQLTAPVGVYPQDLCLLPGGDMLAVCGGADGTVRLLTISDLQTVQIIHVPGIAQRIAFTRGMLHVLCLTEDDGLQCLLCRITLPAGRYEPVTALPGIPGAICAEPAGGIWVCTGETLCHFSAGQHTPDRILPGFGLIRHMDWHNGELLITDPVMEICALIERSGKRHVIHEGEVHQAIFI